MATKDIEYFIETCLKASNNCLAARLDFALIGRDQPVDQELIQSIG